MKQFDVVALGELLIDMTDNGRSGQGNVLYEANPGGAPCNVLSMLKKLGHTVGFIGKVGDDIFGHELKSVLEEVGIDTKGLVIDKDVRTTLAFVKTFEDGDRDFSFYRNPGADMMLDKDEVNADIIRNSKIFHFGTLSMTHPVVRAATLFALDQAKAAKALISFDPNIREPLWDSMDEAREQVLKGLEYCDILKISDNEIQWLTGIDDYADGVKWILSRYPARLVTVSLGKNGSMNRQPCGVAFLVDSKNRSLNHVCYPSLLYSGYIVNLKADSKSTGKQINTGLFVPDGMLFVDSYTTFCFQNYVTIVL